MAISLLFEFENHQLYMPDCTDSIKEKGLQIADLIAWSIFQSLEHDDFEFLDLIKNKNVDEVFK